MAAAAAGLHMATAARRRLSLGYESCISFFSKGNSPPLSPTSTKISDLCSSLYGFSGNSSILVVCGSSSSNPSCNAAMLVLKRALHGSWGPHHSGSHYYHGEPQRIIAPVWQISFTNPEECWRDGVMCLGEFCDTFPIWKEIQHNPLVRSTDNLRVLNEPWRWFVKSLNTVGSFNHCYGVTACPSFTKDNVLVSRRFHQAVLKDPVGFSLFDLGLKSLFNSDAKCNGQALTYHAIGSLFEDLLEEFQPGVPKPLDVDWLLNLMSKDLVSLEVEDLIVNNPCLMSNPGRIGFTNYTHHLLSNVLARSNDPLDTMTLQDAISSLATLPELMVRGFAILGLQRNGLRHAFDPRYRKDPAIKSLGEYTLDDVVEHQHCKFPLCFPKIGDAMLSMHKVHLLFLYHFFHVHPQAFKR
ncbi:uncharacterized protein LOC119309530 [Triticum dicoccoides]|uniref:uncharacterized protein LOC119309530 n=1 Tax=Triticum dicoccoides TaxID=85692 RepID=UPI001890ECF0|nr:uncharacterized protein LOC119309530 [Triticum dicoccoides]